MWESNQEEMRSYSENLLRGIEYKNWYQIIRPIGFTNEQPRVEILKMADESDLRLRDSVPWGLGKMKNRESIVQTETKESSQQILENNEEAPDTSTSQDGTKRQDTNTYLSPGLKDFQDQDAEIENIFWELLKSVHPTCPDDVDLEAIRTALAQRRARLGRDKSDSQAENTFDKYGLGINAKVRSLEKSEIFELKKENLLDMIDRMVAERTKSEAKHEDFYDKNNPIKGRVRFRRGEFSEGSRYYTELDERLTFGDVEVDADFKPYMISQNRGRLNSKGVFIPGMFDHSGNFIPGNFDKHGNLLPGPSKRRDTTFDRQTIESKGKRKRSKKRKDVDSVGSRRSKRSKALSHLSEAGRKNYLKDLRKSHRHPESDFPVCNYPKWVHRMFRMDQVKIGQLIQQGMDVPKYTPPWMLETLDRVWDAQDEWARGLRPSDDPEYKKSRFSDLEEKVGVRDEKTLGESVKGSLKKEKRHVEDQEKVGLGGEEVSRDGGAGEGGGEGHGRAGEGGGRGNGRAGEEGGKGKGRAGEGGGEGNGRPGEGGGEGNGRGTEKGLGKGLGDIAEFLQPFEKEAIDLATIDADYGKKTRKHEDTSFDINDLIDQYQENLVREEKLDKNEPASSTKKEKMEKKKAKRIEEIPKAAPKRIIGKDRKIKLQERYFEERKLTAEQAEEELSQQDNLLQLAENNEILISPSGKLLEKKKDRGKPYRGSPDRILGHKKSGKWRRGKHKTSPDRSGPQTSENVPCPTYKPTPVSQEREAECMRRFQVLLGNKKTRFSGKTDFVELAKQIAMIKYDPAPPKLTPCERAKLTVCP